MRKDRLHLLKYSLVTVLLIAGWFGVASVSRNILLRYLLGWVGFGVIALYWGWLLRTKKLRPPK
jgi:hypothetical protein